MHTCTQFEHSVTVRYGVNTSSANCHDDSSGDPTPMRQKTGNSQTCSETVIYVIHHPSVGFPYLLLVVGVFFLVPPPPPPPTPESIFWRVSVDCYYKILWPSKTVATHTKSCFSKRRTRALAVAYLGNTPLYMSLFGVNCRGKKHATVALLLF